MDAAPSDTSIGVTTFADRASVLLAPTKDRGKIHAALNGIKDTREGTALGAAVTTSLAALQANGSVSDPPPSDPSDSPGRILVLTDGANSIKKATTPEAAAERAAASGVPIYTILLGDDRAGRTSRCRRRRCRRWRTAPAASSPRAPRPPTSRPCSPTSGRSSPRWTSCAS